MTPRSPNLAARPFENLRPIRRAAALLWLVALGLAFWNGRDFFTTRAGAAELVAELGRREAEVARLRSGLDQREAELVALDLASDNARTRFLNERIAERTFSWNRLLDRMAEALPRKVRLVSLTPSSFTGRARLESRGRELARFGERVEITIQGVAEDSESLLEFVDRLFAHPAFRDPNLAREAETKQGQIDFGISLVYLPKGESVIFAGEPTAGGVGERARESTLVAEVSSRGRTAVGRAANAGVARGGTASVGGDRGDATSAGAARGGVAGEVAANGGAARVGLRRGAAAGGSATRPAEARAGADGSDPDETPAASEATSPEPNGRVRDWRSASDRSSGEGRAFTPVPLGNYASDTGRQR